MVEGSVRHERGAETGTTTRPVLGLRQVERIGGLDAVVGVVVSSGEPDAFDLAVFAQAVDTHELCLGHEPNRGWRAGDGLPMGDQAIGVRFREQFGDSACGAFPVFPVVYVDALPRGLASLDLAELGTGLVGDAGQPDAQEVLTAGGSRDRRPEFQRSSRIVESGCRTRRAPFDETLDRCREADRSPVATVVEVVHRGGRLRGGGQVDERVTIDDTDAISLSIGVLYDSQAGVLPTR